MLSDIAIAQAATLRPIVELARERLGIPEAERQRLVAGVGVQRLRPAHDRRQRLDRHPHDVVVRLLRRERRAGGLGVEA